MATATLVCKQCNFENEPERVYCHNCGAKLDRTLLPPEATRREDPVVVQQRVRKLVSPNRGGSLSWLKFLVSSLVISAVLAVLVVMFKPPANIPPELSKEAVMNAPNISDDLASLTEMPGGRPVRYPEDQVNAFLQSSLRGQANAGAGYTSKFERLFVRFHEGSCSITMQETVLGLPVYATTNRTIAIEKGAVVSRVLGGSLGRLKIPVAAMPSFEHIFAPVLAKLEHDRATIARLRSVTLREKAVDAAPK